MKSLSMKKSNKLLFFPFILSSLLIVNILIPTRSFSSITLKDKFEKAEKGDFIVTLENKTYSILVIQNIFFTKNQDKVLSLAEISIPASEVKSKTFLWKKWIEGNQLKSSSYNIYEIDLKNSKILKAYSVTKKSFFNSTEQDNFFTKLLTLPLEKLSNDKRKKIGPPPLDNSLDTRAYWTPPMVVDGKKQPNSSFDVYQTLWPKDGTDLSGKVIDIYFDKENFLPFPYWIQVSNGNIDVMLKIIDSGKNLSCEQKIPK